MGRKAKPDLERYNVKLPSELVARLDDRAEVEKRTRSELLADGAEMYLKRAKAKPPKKQGK